MPDDLLADLKIIISVQLTMIPRRVRRDYAERRNIRSDPARDKMATEIAKNVARVFELTRKPTPMGHGTPK